jgi:sugar diacid utilization regulator
MSSVVNGVLALRPVASATRAICTMVADRLEADATDLAQVMAETVFREVPVYRGQRAELSRTVLKHSLDHVHAVVRTIRTWTLPAPDELSFVRAQAALRAGQGLPLNALLHSYRLGHRTVWERLVEVLGDRDDVLDAVLALTTLTLGYTDLISAVLAEGYFEQQRHLLVELDRDRRDLLENLLLGSVGHRAETLQLAATFDLVPAAELVVAVVSSQSSLTSDALTRAAETMRHHLSVAVAQPFVVVRHHEIVALVPVGRLRSALLGRLMRAAHGELSQRGEPWAAGVSTLCLGLSEVPRGYEEARHALDTVAAQAGVATLLDMRVSDYLVERADATVLRMVPPAARRLLESTVAADRILVETLLAYAGADMAVRVVAERLSVHANTVTYRLAKIKHLLGRDPMRFSDLVELLAWVRIVKNHNQSSSPAQPTAY